MLGHNIQTHKNKNIIHINQWNHQLKLREDRQSLSRYYRLLSFHELIGESKELVREIKNNKDYCQLLTLKSKLILKEFSSRVGIDSKELSNLINLMSHQIESRTIALNNYCD